MTSNIAVLPQMPQPNAYNPCNGSLFLVVPQAAVNLCTNPSFEISTDNWTTDGVFARTTTPYVGAYSASFTGGTNIVYGTTTAITAAAGQQLAVSCYLYNLSETKQTYTITVSNATPTVQSSWSYTAPPKQWRRFVGVAYITSGTQFTFKITGNDFLIDACQFEIVNGHSATTYFDGDTISPISANQLQTPMYMWQGAAHKSVSNRSSNAANGGRVYNLQNELGMLVVGISGGDLPAYNNQTVQYYGTDGAALQDIITPPRALTIVGRIYGATREELHRKVSIFAEHFSRDTTAYRQPKSFLFQHLTDDGDEIGVPLTFSGIITNAFTAVLSGDLTVQVGIQLSMIDPYFYGHTESSKFDLTYQKIQQAVFSYVPEFTSESSASFTQYLQAAGNVNGSINAIVTGLDGIVYFGGNFTQVGGVGMNFIASYNPTTKTFAGLGATPSTVLNGAVNALALTPDGLLLYIGGNFTTANGAAAMRIVQYDIQANSFVTLGGGVGGGVNGLVLSIAIRTRRTGTLIYPYQIYIGGSFTASTSGTVMNRLAYFDLASSIWASMGTGGGVTGTVYAVIYNANLDRIYFGGSFATSQGGAVTLNNIGYVNYPTFTTTVPFYIGFNSDVRALYSNPVDNTLYVGGSFAFLSDGTTVMKRAAVYTGVVWRQVDLGMDNGIVYNIVPYQNGVLFVGSFLSANAGHSGESVFLTDGC